MIAVGGGTLTDPRLRAICKDKSYIIYLAQELDSFLPRLEKLRPSRPLLKGKSKDEVRVMFIGRAESYEDSDFVVPVDRTPPERTAQLITEWIRQKKL